MDNTDDVRQLLTQIRDDQREQLLVYKDALAQQKQVVKKLIRSILVLFFVVGILMTVMVGTTIFRLVYLR